MPFSPTRRNEDPRLLRGLGSFVDDIDPPGVLHVAILRSPYGHAEIASIDTSAARAQVGVHAVYTASDLGEFNQPAPLVIPHPNLTHGHTQKPLADGKVRFIGEAVAMVVADDRYLAEDAAGLIEVDWRPLQAVVDFRLSADPEQPRIHADAPNNVAARLVQTVGEPERAFADAPHVFEEHLLVERSCGSPIEARGVAAVFEPREQTLTVWDNTQAPLTIKNGLANML
ncbi:MAG: xanthine dehydrogenase family protein molybdopterin-binding subunit, partial [Chloroflexi bacterium]|nr:xanthine dehydrogenase family protein molybdopterin-binding subunit [Chloroflexota bacterium]